MLFFREKRFEKISASFFLIPFLFAILFFFFSVPLFFMLDEAMPVSAPIEQARILILDAGHGGEDCGAIGANGIYEKDLNFEITMELGRQLEDLGYKVVYTRRGDKLLYTEDENIKGLRKIYDLKNRVKIAESYEDAIFISLHMNAFSDARYSGLQVFYGKNEKSEALARSIQSHVKETLQPQNKRNIRDGAGMYLMENLDCPAVLIECGFLTNAEECEKLCEKEYQKQLCFAILCGIIDVNGEV